MNESQASTDTVFHMHEITKVYRMGDVELHALRGVTLELLPGEFVVMLGSSGSGKSILLNILSVDRTCLRAGKFTTEITT